jgi:hypothetical protein
MKQKSWFRKKLTFTFANGAIEDDLIQEKSLACMGEMCHLTQIIDDNTNGVTAQLEILDPDNPNMYDFTAKAHNAQYDFDMLDGTIPRLILTGDASIRCTIGGDPGTSGTVVTVIAYVFGIN